jgi:hypothetical protein
LYYVYSVKLGLGEDSFFTSTLSRVLYLIEKWSEEEKMKAAALSGKPVPEPPRTARSIKEVMSYYAHK